MFGVRGVAKSAKIPDEELSFFVKTTLGGVDFGSVQIRSALTYCLLDGILAQIMVTLVDTFSVAAALSVKAPAIAISLLSCLPLFLGSIGQALLLGRINPTHGRKQFILFGIRLQIFWLILAACVPFFFKPPQSSWIFVFMLVFSSVCGSIFSNLWMTWFSDLVPDEIMGRHTGWRNTIFTPIQLIAGLLVGIIARRYTTDNTPWIFFAAVFLTGALFRIASSIMLSRQYEPPMKHRDCIMPLWRFKPSSQFVLFALATTLFNASAGMSGPFFSVWFLRDLHFDYMTFTINAACATFGAIISFRYWGTLVDRVGSVRVIKLTGAMAAIVPLPYLFFDDPKLLWFFQIYSGISWAGFGMSSFKYMLKMSDRQFPEHAISFLNLMQGIFSFVFGLLGGFLATHLPELFGWKLRSLFLLSGIMRFSVFLFLIMRIGDVGRNGPAKRMFQKITGYLENFRFGT